MWRRLGSRALELVARVGSDPADPPDLGLRKAFLVLVSIIVMPPAAIWGAMYWALGERTAALMPWGYLVYSCAAIAVFHRLRSFTFLRRAELLAILVTPFVLGVVLGGLVPSSGVILWSLLAPFGAIVFDTPRRAWTWFIAFLVLVLATTPLAAVVRPVPAELPATMVLAFMVLNIATVSSIGFFILATFARQREEAQERADGLLLNILPASIAEQLKTDRRQIARHYDEASVLFADVVDFTPLAARLSASEIVDLLDRLFSDFDDLVDRHGVEKIKTIGDAYMVAAGVPRPRPDHAHALAALALEMAAVASRHRRADGGPISLRIGIESGPLVAGVIGRRKFIYDLWGDTVNVASRMESHGVPGRIQIGEPTYELIKDAFACEPRGEVQVKGKGSVRTWYVIGPRTAVTDTDDARVPGRRV
jgi:adenylate cyclase